MVYLLDHLVVVFELFGKCTQKLILWVGVFSVAMNLRTSTKTPSPRANMPHCCWGMWDNIAGGATGAVREAWRLFWSPVKQGMVNLFGCSSENPVVDCFFWLVGFKLFCVFTATWGNDPIWLIFSDGLKPPTSCVSWLNSGFWKSPNHHPLSKHLRIYYMCVPKWTVWLPLTSMKIV